MSEATFAQAATAYRSGLEQYASMGARTEQDAEAHRHVVYDMQRAYLALRTTEEGRTFVESMTADPRARVALVACPHALAWDSQVAKARLVAFTEQGEPYASMARIILAEYERSDEYVRGLSWTPPS